MKTAMYAIIKKNFRGVASNCRLFSALLIVPLVLTIVLPSIFVIAIHFVPDDPDVVKLLSLLPEAAVFLIIPLILLIAGQFTGVLLISPKCLIVKKLRLMISQAEFLINQLSRIVSQKSGMPLRAVLYSIRFRSAGWAAAAADLA